ncbi:unnamed protein product [Oikopleura dioica]|uniref:[histone H3]-trimethyl-L-lysine(27) demethylase n=1 Tax=Oikopleura dioica TaxID=34765 RepID=E4YRT8_OIKDI|nr:unnamed protein product [Oikopleura dioica]
MKSEDDELTEDELEQSADWDSRNFGDEEFLPNGGRYQLLQKIIRNYQRKIAGSSRADAEWLLKLGHYHLLGLQWHLALSAYSKCLKLSKWEDHQFCVIRDQSRFVVRPNNGAKSGRVMLLYGLGLCYFHFSNFSWAKNAFLEVLYREPEFHCAQEVHARLGISLKYMKLYSWAAKHLQWALSVANRSPDRCPMSVAEIKFHLGHTEELRKNYYSAKTFYESVIDDDSKSKSVEAAANSTLGWMLFRTRELGEKTQRIQAAIKLLQRATQLDDNSGQTWYYLGRCFSAANDVNSAFNNYRKSIDKSEACADTWCSIGVLYQEQKQHTDALQAFICAVQLDPTHVEAWIDLGVLYESKRQFKDAFKCFNRAYTCSVHCAEPREELFHKAKSLQDMESSAAGPQAGLTSIEKAWTMPIPAELTQRQAARCAPPRNFKKKTSASSSSGPSWLMNEMESNVLRTLQNNSNALTPFQKAELERLKYLQKCTEYFKKHVKSENVPADAALFEEKAQKETDYAKELSVIKEKDTKLEIENRSPPFFTVNPKPMEINPEAPLIQVDTKKEANSKVLSDICTSSKVPTVLIRGISAALKMDLGFFSTKMLSTLQGQNKIISSGKKSQKNFYSEQSKSPGEKWSLAEKVTTSTIKEYGIYQGKNFREALSDDSRRSDKKKAKKTRPRPPVRLAEVNDLTVPEQNYREHLSELHKLPPFMRICSAQNMLTYCGQQHTKAQLLLSVPSCRVPPRHSVFAKVSLNVGPGDYEWFIVPEWWHVEFSDLLSQQGKTFSESWWPDLEACAKHSIPIYRFIQKPGDLVWIQSGSIYWAQSLGWCNNIMYNVGPLTAYQYQIAIQIYEKSLINSSLPSCPMFHISWSLARLVRVSDFRMYSQIKFFLQRSLWALSSQEEFLKNLKIDVVPYRSSKVAFCSDCRRELFLFIWVPRKSDTESNQRQAFCQTCALRSDREEGNWCVLSQASLDELQSTFNKFNFHKTPQKI